jgi:hypothetical protein
MGTLGNGDSGPPDDLPELPPGWGPIRIPDDASELADEAAQIRRELAERPRLARPPVPTVARRRVVPGLTTEPASLKLPLLIMSAALLAAIVSLFAVAWPGDRRQPDTDRTATTTSASTARTVPAIDLLDETNSPVALRALLPAAILMTDACACADEAAALAAAAPETVTVIMLSRQVPDPPAPTPALPEAVRRLRDPAGTVHDFLGLETGSGPGPVVLVGRTGEIVRVVPGAGPLPDRSELASLPAR